MAPAPFIVSSRADQDSFTRRWATLHAAVHQR